MNLIAASKEGSFEVDSKGENTVLQNTLNCLSHNHSRINNLDALIMSQTNTKFPVMKGNLITNSQALIKQKT